VTFGKVDEFEDGSELGRKERGMLSNGIASVQVFNDHPALVYCNRNLEAYHSLLADYKSGRRKSGESADGRSWSDTTAEQIAFLEKNINELAAIVNGSVGVEHKYPPQGLP
jgi:hypothetical protein